MKHVLIGIALFSAVATSAFAVTPTTEPSLPADVETWGRQESRKCTHADKTLLMRRHTQVIEEFDKTTETSLMSYESIIVFYINGEKVNQSEYSRLTNYSSGDIWVRHVRYIRNSPGKNWLQYDKKEAFSDEAQERLLAEIGLTVKEFVACKP